MNISEYKNFLLQNIQPWAKEASGGREINCRCFYCPDSKTRSKGHMYIKIPQSENDISTFYCQKCKTTGIVKLNFFLLLKELHLSIVKIFIKKPKKKV